MLYVDNDEDGCEMITEFLKAYDPRFLVTSVGSAIEAVAAICAEKFDAIVTDNWLPGHSGVEFCKEIRQSDALTPIIIFSAAADADSIKTGLSAGASEYLVKPDGLTVLGRTIKNLITKFAIAK